MKNLIFIFRNRLPSLNSILCWLLVLGGFQVTFGQFAGWDVTGNNPNCYTCYAIQEFNVDAVATLDCGKVKSTAEVTVNYACETLEVEADGIRLTDGLQASAGCVSSFRILNSPPPVGPGQPLVSLVEVELPIDKFEEVILTADDIGTPAIYNWYDNEGNLIYVGQDLVISNAVAERYRLETISTLDGLIEYKDVDLVLKPNRLETLYPNPAMGGNLNIKYKINEAASAYIMINSYYMSGGVSNNYILNVDATEVNVDINSFPNGLYKVVLITDGQVVDMKILSTF